MTVNDDASGYMRSEATMYIREGCCENKQIQDWVGQDRVDLLFCDIVNSMHAITPMI